MDIVQKSLQPPFFGVLNMFQAYLNYQVPYSCLSVGNPPCNLAIRNLEGIRCRGPCAVDHT